MVFTLPVVTVLFWFRKYVLNCYLEIFGVGAVYVGYC